MHTAWGLSGIAAVVSNLRNRRIGTPQIPTSKQSAQSIDSRNSFFSGFALLALWSARAHFAMRVLRKRGQLVLDALSRGMHYGIFGLDELN
jgi:hypothetical protein